VCGGGSVSAAAAPRLVSPRLGLEACGVRVSASDSEDMWPRGGTAAQPRRRRRQNCSAARRSRRPGTSTPTGGLAAGGSPPRPCGCRGRCSVQRYARGAAVARSTPFRALAGSVVRGMAGSSPYTTVAIKKGPEHDLGVCTAESRSSGTAKLGGATYDSRASTGSRGGRRDDSKPTHGGGSGRVLGIGLRRGASGRQGDTD
jgi:hypothetical protein